MNWVFLTLALLLGAALAQAPSGLSTSVSSDTVTVRFTERAGAKTNYVFVTSTRTGTFVAGGCSSNCYAKFSGQPQGSAYAIAISFDGSSWGSWSNYELFFVGTTTAPSASPTPTPKMAAPSASPTRSPVFNTGSGTAGVTTRYWDCCKASCGWAYKAQVTRPVKSCAKDGITEVGINEANVCTGGNSHMCNNQQPWVTSDPSVSYGFAAAHIKGQGESDWCCACYEVTFTEAPLLGKKMIVQVTNTGGDLGDDHFDLQIPGGGVGIFNGCQLQWGAPSDGWGARYGGISSRSQCYDLPSALRPGCFWRFDWFAGADNPRMNYRQVACPKDLTDRTLCIRN